MCKRNSVLFFIVLFHLSSGVRINFTSCQDPEWECVNNFSSDIVYTCSSANDFIIHIKDYYSDVLRSVTVQNCSDLKVVLDCPLLQKPSNLKLFRIKHCDRLEFITLTSASLLQTPPELDIEDVKEIIALPSKIVKSPTNNYEQKCIGTNTIKRIRIAHSKINNIKTRAIYNVTGIRSIEFENVTILNIESDAINVVSVNNDSLFSIINSSINKISTKGITVDVKTFSILGNTFKDLPINSLNITSEYLRINDNVFNDIFGRSILTKSVNIDISNNEINTLKRNALAEVKSQRKRDRPQLIFARNKLKTLEPYSLNFDYDSLKSIGTLIVFNNNKMDCLCRNIAFLNAKSFNNHLSNLILNVEANNTCLSAPCYLPVEVVKLLMESDMCQINLDTKVMCLLYNDRHMSTNELPAEDDVTEPAPTFYLIRQAKALPGDSSAAMTAINTVDLLRDSSLNSKNRTTVKVVFDSTKDFVETLRSTSHSKPAVNIKTEPVNRCTANQCRNKVAHDRQKALDFYKYVYAQLRPPKV